MPPRIIFEPDRLRQARQLALMTKREVADASGVSPAAIGQYEAGVAVPRPETIESMARALDVYPEFFAPGRPLQRLDTSETYFESLRSTTVKQRHNATAFAEQVWELSFGLEAHVRLPALNLPDFSSEPNVRDLAWAAKVVREAWGLGEAPAGHLVANMEANGIICCLAPPSEQEVARINAYSTLAFGRPVVVLTPDRSDDVFRHRFSAAHELGHLVLHGGSPSGEPWLEREANAFAAEFLAPATVMADALPRRIYFPELYRMGEQWGVSVKTLVYRAQELGLISESTARRAYIRLAQSPQEHRPIRLYEGEVPALLKGALELAGQRGVGEVTLAEQLKWKPRRVRNLIGADDPRPELRIVT